MKLRPPSHWEQVNIGEVAKVVGGGTPTSTDQGNFTDHGGIPWLTPADLSGYRQQYIERGARNLTEQGYKACSARKMPAGTVLFSSRAPIGYVAIAKNELATNQGFKSFVLSNGLDSRFVYYCLRYIKPIAEQRATGTTFKELSGSAAAKLPFLIAPEPEQKRIADKLDDLLARVDACRERLNRVPAMLKRLRQTIFGAAVKGTLINGRMAHSWTRVSLAEVCHSITDGDHQAPPQAKSGVRFITIAAINDRKLRLEKATRYVPPSYFEGLKPERRPQTGDVLFSVTGSICIPALVEQDTEFAFQRHIAILKPDREKIEPRYLYIALSTDDIAAQGTAVATGSAQMTIPLKGLRALSIPLPSLEEQVQIVNRVDALLDLIDRSEARLADAMLSVNRLTPSLLAKAFRGELVAQDLNDEPVGELLRRISELLTANNSKTTRVRKIV